jgi:hypothetical protein
MDNSCAKLPRWSPIPGFDGYKASFLGEIMDARNGRIKRQREAGNGTMQVDIGKSTRMVHDLVARAYHGHPIRSAYRVIHRNGDGTDNQLENLLWAGKPRKRVFSKREPVLSLGLDAEYQRRRQERADLLELMQPDVGIPDFLRGSNRPRSQHKT